MIGAVNLRTLVLTLALGSLFGCSQDGFIPGGPHALAAGQLRSLVSDAAQAYGVKPELVSAVIDAESHGDPSAISRSGAAGLMQLMPQTSSDYGVGNPFDARSNVDGGTHYLHDLLRRYHNNIALALAAYNAGPATVDAVHGIPAIPETQSYVSRIIANLR
jgi:soluble lytic murein transglycosylase-like protein